MPQRQRISPKIYFGILATLQGIMALEFVLLLRDRQWLNAALVVAIVGLSVAPAFLGRRFSVKIPSEFQLAAALFVFASLFLGELQGYYTRFWWWDVLLHGMSGLLLGVVGFLMVYVLNRSPAIGGTLRPAFIATFSFLFAVAIGAIWEVFEYVGDRLLGTAMQSGGLDDTMWDLILDSVGALVISALGWIYLRRGEPSFVDTWIQSFVRGNPRIFRRDQ